MLNTAWQVSPIPTIRAAAKVVLAVAITSGGLAACSNGLTTASVSPATLTVAPTSEAPGAPIATLAGASPVPSTADGTPSANATPTATRAGGLDVCALLSTAESSEVLGGGAVQAKQMPNGGWIAGQCAWNGPESGFLVAVGTVATIAAAGDPAALDAKSMFMAFRNSGTATDVPGIGDGAALGAIGLAAYTDGVYLQITNLGLTEDQLVEIAKRLIARV